MKRLRGTLPSILLAVFGTLTGLMTLEIGARGFAVREERRQGRFGRDLSKLKSPSPGTVVTLGQIILPSEDPKIVYRLKPRLDVVFAGARMTTSDGGYRGRDVATPKPPNTYRILGIGDSYMFGQGVTDDETYMSKLPHLLKGAYGGRSVETVNLAVPGFNTVMEVTTLAQRGVALEPDLVLIEIVGNDLDLPNFLWNAVDPWTMRRSFLLDFVRGRMKIASVGGLAEAPRETEGSMQTFSREGADVPAQYASMVGLPAFERAIDELGAYAAKHQVPLLALTHGVWFEDAMLRALAKNSIPVLVLRQALRQRARSLGAPDYARSPLAQSTTNLHPSAQGHQVIAEELARWMETAGPRS